MFLPFLFVRLLWRARRQPEYLNNLGERFGFYSISISKPVIWLHTVSVGETRAVQNLVLKLNAQYPDHQILLTHMTPTGKATCSELFGNTVVSVYLPYDYPFAIRRFLNHFRPSIGVLMETEIWFNLIRLSKKFSVSLLLLNARMSEKSAHKYACFPQLSSTALNNLAGIAAQTVDDATRFTRLGAKNVSVMGNLKFDIRPPYVARELGKLFRKQFGETRQIFLVASTREGEEALILDALLPRNFLNVLLIIVPRHPQRFEDVAYLLEQRNIAYQRRSENLTVSNNTQVVLGDSMGELFAYYTCADFAFIGGSLLPYGGQNLIEACAVGVPVLVGKHTYNFSEVTKLATSSGAAIQVNSVEELVDKLQTLLNRPDLASAMRQHCVEFVDANCGATSKALQLIKDLYAG